MHKNGNKDKVVHTIAELIQLPIKQ
jgi:hypothetical protein